MALPLWTILVATIGLIWFLRRRQAKKDKLGKLKEPPGPGGLPLIGNIHQLGAYPNKQFCKWSEQFGDIYQIKLGPSKVVVISDPKLHKELFSDPRTVGRADFSIFEFYPNEFPGLGIANAEGERWEVHRRFLLRQLRDFGFGKSSMQALIMDEVSEVLQTLKKKEGSPVGDIKNTLRLAVVNSLWSILSSKRFKQDDPELLKLAVNMSDKFNEVITNGQILLFMPWVRHIIPEMSGYKELFGLLEENRLFFEETIREKKRNYKDGDLNDFIDGYLAEMKKAENDPNSQFYGRYAELQLATILFDLFFAGSDTTATTLAWSVLYLCKFPEVQKKLQDEIAQATGDSRSVSVDDRPNMPYALALIEEISRFASIAPDGLQHRATADIEFHGYLIEKDSLIQANMYHIHHSPKFWDDPNSFRPERFLTPDGKKLVKSDNLQAFQVGRRQCVGETLARDTLFLFMTNLFQQFNIKFDPSMEKEPELESEPGFLLSPCPYSVIMNNRLKK